MLNKLRMSMYTVLFNEEDSKKLAELARKRQVPRSAVLRDLLREAWASNERREAALKEAPGECSR